MSTATTLLDYWNKLDAHHWTYRFGDDASADAYLKLSHIADESPEHRALYDAFHAHKFSGSAFGSAELPKPERPAMSGLDVGRVP